MTRTATSSMSPLGGFVRGTPGSLVEDQPVPSGARGFKELKPERFLVAARDEPRGALDEPLWVVEELADVLQGPRQLAPLPVAQHQGSSRHVGGSSRDDVPATPRMMARRDD